MKAKKLSVILLAAFALVSCSQDDNVGGVYKPTDITVNAPEFDTDWTIPGNAGGGKQRIKLDLDETTGLKFSWTQGDMVGVFAQNSEQQLPMIMSDGQEAGAKVYFDREDYQLKQGVTYVGYYPVVDRLTQKPNIEISYKGQVQDANGSYSHLAKYDYLVSNPVAVEKTNTADFYFNHQGAILRLMIDMPEADTYSKVTLEAKENGNRASVFTTKATMNLFNTEEVIQTEATSNMMTLDFKENSVYTTAGNKVLEAWVMVSPVDFTSRELTVTVKSATGKSDVVYTVNPGKNFVKGKAYQIKVPGDVEVDETIFGLKWAPCNTRSWIDAVKYNDDIYVHSYIPTIPLAEQGITFIYDSERTIFTDTENPVAYHYQWDRDFGFAASNYAYDSNYKTRLPNASNIPSSFGAYYAFDDGYYNDINIPISNPDYFIYPQGRNDYCSVSRTKWADRMDSYGFSAAPEGFHIPTLAEWNTLRPENENKVYTYASSGIKVNDGTAYPFYVKHEDGCTIIWSMWQTSAKKYLDVRRIGGTYTLDNLTTAVMEKCENPLQLPADGYRSSQGTLQWQERGLYWASDSPDATSGTSYAFSFTIDTSNRTIRISSGTQPRKFAFSVRCIYDAQ